GAASGIGAGTAEVFAEKGAALVLVDRDEGGLRDVAAALAAGGARVERVAGDVAQRETAERAAARAVDAFGAIDILFNNAGVMTSGDFRDWDEARWDALLDINLRGIYLMCRAVVPRMLEQGAGSIINTSSVMAFLTEPGYEAYTTSKAGIVGLTKALAVSYAERGLRVNCIQPGWIDTPMNRRLADELGGMDNLIPLIRKQQPLPRMITTREVGNLVAFLASDEASAISGAAIPIDGAASAAI
ncbi:MAG TPA: SDR family NAD(P)-dependent oxidoreductase, partial [Thermomicrobiales bacterium]|nr:SDR family NAD(P)-dependent oxidoreductase [Thermomicrobiales bacterium]